MELQPFSIAGDTVTRSVTTSSARVALTQAPSSPAELTVIVFNEGPSTAFVKFGSSTVTAAVASGHPIAAGASEVFSVNATANTHLAAITAASTATLYVTSGAGIPYGYGVGGLAAGPATGSNVNIAAAGGVAVVAGTAPVPVGFYNPTGGALLDPTAAAEVVGNVASAATDSGKPVKAGAKYVSTMPMYSTGQRTDLIADVNGNLRALLVATPINPTDGIPNTSLQSALNQNDNVGGGTRALYVGNAVYNGSTWDRMRSAGSALGLLTENGPYLLGRVVADGQIKGSAGFIHTVSIAPLTATPTAGLLTIYNSTTETGTVVYSEWIFATTVGHTITLDIPCSTGIYVGFDGTLANVQVTVAYR